MMQPDEQRVIDALQAFTGGLIVTDQDITLAESRLRENLEPPPPRRRLVILAAAVVAVLVAGFFAAQAIGGREGSAPPAHTPSSPADTLKEALDAHAYNLGADAFTAGARPSAQDMAGFWMLREPYYFLMFVDGDGDWWMGSPRAAGAFGHSTLSGDTWTRQHDDRSECVTADGRGFSQAWRTTLAADGSLHLIQTGGEPTCTPADDKEVWDRVTPGSPVADYLRATAEEADWQPAPRSFRWQGVYVSPETGHVIEVADDASYRFYDTFTDAALVAADRGQLWLDDETTATCAGGTFTATSVEVAQLAGVAGYIGSFDAVRLHTSRSCESGFGSEEVWVNVAS